MSTELLSCDEVELELSGDAPSAEARAHVEGCARCRQTAQVLGLAALPPLTDAERLVLAGVAPGAEAQWRAAHRRGDGLRRVVSLALAAGLGAVVASGALLSALPAPTTGAVEPQPPPEYVTSVPEFPEPEIDEANLSDDEVFFEVGWPSPTEGDL